MDPARSRRDQANVYRGTGGHGTELLEGRQGHDHLLGRHGPDRGVGQATPQSVETMASGHCKYRVDLRQGVGHQNSIGLRSGRDGSPFQRLRDPRKADRRRGRIVHRRRVILPGHCRPVANSWLNRASVRQGPRRQADGWWYRTEKCPLCHDRFVLVNETTEQVTGDETKRWGSGSGSVAGQRYVEVEPSVRTSFVVVQDVLTKDHDQMTTVEHQHPVEPFGSDRPGPAFHEGVGSRRSTWR